MTKRRVLAITGIRSEYFLQRPILSAIRKHPSLDLDLIVAGAHLSPLHRYTVRTVEEDGFPIAARIDSLLYSDQPAARLKGGALQLQLLAHIVDERRPDWLLAVGDREEPMMLALCGAYLSIPTAHYAAGDRVVGNVDDMVRHAISRLAHLLLTTNEDARQRLVRSGEQEWRVHNVGHAGLDRLRTAPTLTTQALVRELDVSAIETPYLVVVQHPLSSEVAEAGPQMRATLEAVVKLGLQAFVTYPNSDPGSQQVIQVIEEYRHHPRIHAFRNIPDVPFVNLLRGAAVLVGNSSLGLLEAAYLKLAVVNVGRRQQARHHAENVFFVSHDPAEIVWQVQRLLEDRDLRLRVEQCSNPFGNGHTGRRVASLLADLPLDANLLNKDLTH